MAAYLLFLLDGIQAVFYRVFDSILQGVASLLVSIPLPDSAVNGTFTGTLATDVVFFIAPFQLGTGAAFIMSCYTVRFLIRRLPIIG